MWSRELWLVSSLLLAAAASPSPADSGACVLFIPGSLVGFGFGSFETTGAVKQLWSTDEAWAGILGGAFAQRGSSTSAFVTQPTLSSGESPLATLTLRPGGGNASISYSTLTPVKGHEALGAPAILGFASDAVGDRVVCVISSADGSFSYYALASLNASSVAAAATTTLTVLRDISAEVAALGGQLEFGVNAYDPVADRLFLAFVRSANESTVAAFSLRNESAPAELLQLPRNAAAVSLQWSEVVAGEGRPGLVVLAQDAVANNSLAWLALDAAAASLSTAATWTPLFEYAPDSAVAPEIGVGAASRDGKILMALVLDAAGESLSASFVDVSKRVESSRVPFENKKLIAVDIVECKAA
jgi:hypothetical protein